ncbi:MAG: hypothetical protein C4K60_18715 [Ideonella sp. MAG2]|nr:MAG: hypothetical protein C4K60_18715 [Ideonella sp. MAG2]
MKVFVSYSGQTDASPYFKRFCELLEAAIVRAGGAKHVKHVLWDEDLGQGDEWPQKLQAKLNEADVFLPLYSPLYFASVPCGRELGFFMQRVVPAPGFDAIPVLPVWWSDLRSKNVEGFSSPPDSGVSLIDSLQHRSKDTTRHGDYSFNDIERMGLDQFLINEAHVDYKPAVTAYFKQLADRLHQLLSDYKGELRCNRDSLLSSVDVWAQARGAKTAAPDRAVPAPAPLPPTVSGARVHFLVVAARPELIRELSTRNLPNCAVVVPFVAASRHPDVVEQLRDLLQPREELDDPLCKTYVAVNETELEAQIATLHERMRQKFRSRAQRAGARRSASPFGGAAKPNLNAVAQENRS